MTAFPHIFRPLQVGSVTVPNRLFVSAHHTELMELDPTGFHEWSVLGERAAAYHEDRAKGGFGLIMIGQTQVHPQSGSDRPSAYTEQSVRAHARIADRCHAHGTKVFVQLAQNGPERQSSGPDAWAPVWGPSATPSAMASARGEMPKAMDADDIAALVAGFVRSARNSVAAGVDGVEIHAAHPHLLGEWLTPAFNKRTDRYGGSVRNRVRLVVEIADAVRAACGPDFVVGVRINGAWEMPGGQTVDEAVVIGETLAATGHVDFVNVSGWPGIGNIGSQPGWMIPWAAAVKRAVGDLPVFGIGRVVHPEHAEQILARGDVDLVGMTRASIADPELPNKARDGRVGAIRICIGAGQGCLARNVARRPITCQQNPAVGREAEWGIGTLRPADRVRRVVIVGGGPAGLEAAVVAAERGHDVTLLEQGDRLGGQLNLITRVKRRAEYAEVVAWREGRLRDLGVAVELATPATAASVLVRDPDAVVVATGSRPRRVGWYPPLLHLDGIPGGDAPHVITVDDALHGDADEAHHVVVVDGTAFHQTSDVLEHLAARGVRTTALSHHAEVAGGIDAHDRPDFLRALAGSDVRLVGHAVVEAIEPDGVVFVDVSDGLRRRLDGVDRVVVVIGSDVVDGLYHELRGQVPHLERIGDCVAPRGVEHAVFEGHRARPSALSPPGRSGPFPACGIDCPEFRDNS
jgi:2,4-dienoyl-CoA reductase-like NADH-dependent reductase (Old Yellow Enzyme family)